MRAGRLILWVLTTASVGFAADATSRSASSNEPLDSATFRRGLQSRGLWELLAAYDRAHPPANETDRALLAYEESMRICGDSASDPAKRQTACGQAVSTLRKLITEQPSHPHNLRWQYELARYLVEHKSPDAVEALLFRVAPPHRCDEIAASCREANSSLERLLAAVQNEWKHLGSLTPEQFDNTVAANRPAELETIEAASAYLLAWSRMYEALTLTPDHPQRKDVLRQILDEAVTRRQWTSRPHEQTGLQIQALILAGMAARLSDRFDDADRYTQQAISIYADVKDAAMKTSLDPWALLAVLERIRLLIDRKQINEANAAIQRAYTWAAQTRPEDYRAAVSIGLLQRQIGPVASGNDPLLKLAREKPQSRTLIYESLGALVLQRENTASPLPPLDQLAGAWSFAEDATRTETAVKQAVELTASSKDPFIAAESLWLLSRIEAKRNRPCEAAAALLKMVREHSDSDRTPVAIDEAVRLALQAVRNNAACDPAHASQVFVDIVRLIREKRPDDRRLADLSFAAGAAMQNLRQWPEAAAEFAMVPGGHEKAVEASLQRARCLTRLHEAKPDETSAANALKAAKDAERSIQSLAKEKRNECWLAETILMQANILSGSTMHQYRETLSLLKEFENRYTICKDLLGAMWLIRLRAAEASGKLKDAVAMVRHVLETRPQQAGPAMTGLLARMQEQIEKYRAAGEADALRELSGEAAKLAESLETWSAQASPDDVPRIQMARATAMLDADRTADARRLAESADKNSLEWQYVKAECLYKDKAFKDALPLFGQLWQSTPENSSLWWKSLLRSLQCHTETGSNPADILQSIRQHRQRYPAMGGPAVSREFDALEKHNEQRKPAM